MRCATKATILLDREPLDLPRRESPESALLSASWISSYSSSSSSDLPRDLQPTGSESQVELLRLGSQQAVDHIVFESILGGSQYQLIAIVKFSLGVDVVAL